MYLYFFLTSQHTQQKQKIIILIFILILIVLAHSYKKNSVICDKSVEIFLSHVVFLKNGAWCGAVWCGVGVSCGVEWSEVVWRVRDWVVMLSSFVWVVVLSRPSESGLGLPSPLDW